MQRKIRSPSLHFKKPGGCDAGATRVTSHQNFWAFFDWALSVGHTLVARGLVAAVRLPLAAVNKQTALSGPVALPLLPSIHHCPTFKRPNIPPTLGR